MEPWLQSLLLDLPPIMVSVALATLLVSIAIFFFTKPDERTNIYILVFGLATLGAVSGVAGGSSRVGVVGDIIPAALGLAGGVSAYLFGVDRSKGLIASVCAAAFALSLGFGYATGAGNRAVTDSKSANLEFCRKIYSDPKIWGDDRAFCRVATTLGEQCNQLIAGDLARLPEANFTVDTKFTQIFTSMTVGMETRMKSLNGCEPIK